MHLAVGEKALLQGDPSVRNEPLYVSPSEGLPGEPEGALIRLDREVYGRHVRVAISNRLPIERGRVRDERVRALSLQEGSWLCAARGGRPLDGGSHKGTSTVDVTAMIVHTTAVTRLSSHSAQCVALVTSKRKTTQTQAQGP